MLQQNGQQFAVDSFEYIIWNENVWIANKILLKCAPEDPIDNKSAFLVQAMAWRGVGSKPWPKPKIIKISDAIWLH